MASELKREGSPLTRIEEILGEDGRALLEFNSPQISKDSLQTPGPDFVDRVWAHSDRNPQVLRSLQSLFDHGRLGGTGYLSILPVDQGIEHSAGASFAPNPVYFDPETAVGATVYFGSDESGRQIVEIAKAFAHAHELGMATILWCYLRNPKFKTKEGDMHTAADLTGQANHLGVTIEADIIKQKLPERNGGYNLLNVESAYGKTNPKIYTDLTSDNPIDLVRYQVLNCFMGRCGLINSGGESKGASDMADAVRTAVINKRGGGMGLISGRKAFQRPMQEGAQLLNAIQDVYLAEEITVA
jgi:DhnA family fructose-bisphosphate aldolase class Ia